MIMHIDMDAFFASIEQAINPNFKGKPLIVGSRGSKFHTVVCAASYEAKAYGINSGMASIEAFKLCPNLEFVAADQSKYIWTSEEILKMLQGYGFEVVYVSIDEFQIDLPDKSDFQCLAETIQKQIYQTFCITASIGIAKNCLLAKLASKLNKPNGIAVITDANLKEILAKVPIQKLCGVGEKTRLILEGLGIKTCLELYEKSAYFLERNLGQTGINFYASLRSSDRLEPAGKNSAPKSIGHSYTLPRASQNTGFIYAWIRLLSEMTGNRLRQNNLVAKTVCLWLNGPGIGNFSRQKTHQQATNDSYEIYQRSLKILAKLSQRMPKIRALGVTCSSLSNDLYPLLFTEQKRREVLIKTLDRINGKFGEGTIYPAIIDLTDFPYNPPEK